MRSFATLDELRAVATEGILVLIWSQVAMNLAVAQLLGTPWVPPLLLGLLLAMAATATWALAGSGPVTRLVVAVALVGLVSLAVAELDGSPWQIDGHMYFFAALAVLATLCDWRALLFGAAATAAHHLVLNGLLPSAVFPGGADYSRVVLHAVIVVVETAALVWLTYQLAVLFAVSAEARRAADEARRAEIATRDAQRATEAAANARARAESDALASRFEAEIGGAVREAVTVAAGMSGSAGSLSGTVEEVSTRIATVVAASHDTAASVQTVAAAAGQLAHSVGEITRTVGCAAAVAGRAVAETQRTEARVTALSVAAQRIGEVVTLIRGIAGQTNLLALNANIEAARAGETGRGFGVVAAEVKALATQTANATETIQAQIEAIRAGTAEAASAIAGIAGIVGELGVLTEGIAEAVRQQGEATAAIARSTQVAAVASEQVSANLGALATHAQQTGVVALAGRAAAEQLSTQCGQMATAVSRFVETVKAA